MNTETPEIKVHTPIGEVTTATMINGLARRAAFGKGMLHAIKLLKDNQFTLDELEIDTKENLEDVNAKIECFYKKLDEEHQQRHQQRLARFNRAIFGEVE